MVPALPAFDLLYNWFISFLPLRLKTHKLHRDPGKNASNEDKYFYTCVSLENTKVVTTCSAATKITDFYKLFKVIPMFD